MFRLAFVRSLPVLMGYTTMGFAAGVLMGVVPGVPATPFWSGFLALATVSGTLSFVVPAQIGVHASLFSFAALTFAINFRYAFYGFSMLKRWRHIPFLKRYLLIHSLADEIYALDLACQEADEKRHLAYCLWNHVLCASYWVIGTTLGAVVGAKLPFPTEGIEFTMVALFLVIFTDQIKGIVKK